MLHFYGFDQIGFLRNPTAGNPDSAYYNQHAGQGQTIAIIELGRDPEVKQSLDDFDRNFGLPAPPSFQQVNQYGDPEGASNVPIGPASYILETDLDVEWAHAIAPAAKILLVESPLSDVLGEAS